MTRKHIDEAHRLRRERDALRACLKNCADDLEAKVLRRDGRNERDMELVKRARALLKGDF